MSATSVALLGIPALAAQDFNLKEMQSPLEEPDEAYWEMVKRQFAVPAGQIMINAANLCPVPTFINQRVQSLENELSRDVSFQYRNVFTELRIKGIEMLAKFVNALPEEIGITRNTSESNCMVVNGLDIKAGDEVIIWDQNHPSNGAIWEEQARRRGFTVKKVKVPIAPKSPGELTSAFGEAITAKTRLIAFSHISNTSGIMLPAAEICKMARSKDIMTLVDGAQAFGALDLDVKSMQCDFYTASTHKWLVGPMENGVLYITKEKIDRVWPSIAGGGWKAESKTVDEKICVLGQRNNATAAALPEIIDFHQTICKKFIEQRVYELAGYLKKRLMEKISGLEFVTPQSPSTSAGVLIFNLKGKNPTELYEQLYAKYGIACTSAGGIRLSPHIYNTKADLDKVIGAIALLAA